jgi:hypothetical protein
MKVSELIEELQTYNPETELIVAYWDKETIEGYGAPTMTQEHWSEVVFSYENGEWFWQGSASEDFVEIAEKVVATNE